MFNTKYVVLYKIVLKKRAVNFLLAAPLRYASLDIITV